MGLHPIWGYIKDTNDQAIKLLFESSVGGIRSTTILGMLLFPVSLIFVQYRINAQIRRMPTLRTYRCPNCRGMLERSHRRLWEKPVTVFLRLRPYRCTKKECGWRGWRYRA